MAKLIPFASWNVEHFKNSQSRAERCVSFLNDQAGPPDMFAIFEVEGKEVFEHFMALMPSHNFYLTEGPEVQESWSATAFVTQRHKLRSKVPTLRPGTLVTVHIAGANYSFLFLHVKSMRDPRGWGLRADMIEHALGLKKALDKRPGASPAANFIVLGDLNTMGLNVTDGDNDVSGATELERFVRRFRRVDMDLIAKDEDKTWWGRRDARSEQSRSRLCFRPSDDQGPEPKRHVGVGLAQGVDHRQKESLDRQVLGPCPALRRDPRLAGNLLSLLGRLHFRRHVG